MKELVKDIDQFISEMARMVEEKEYPVINELRLRLAAGVILGVKYFDSMSQKFKAIFSDNLDNIGYVRAFLWCLKINTWPRSDYYSGGVSFEGFYEEYLIISKEDHQDYDPPYIHAAQEKATKFAKIFGLPVEIVNLEDVSGGPHHVCKIFSSDLVEDLNRSLSSIPAAASEFENFDKTLNSLIQKTKSKQKECDEQKEKVAEMKKDEAIKSSAKKLQQIVKLPEDKCFILAGMIQEFKKDLSLRNWEYGKKTIRSSGDWVVVAVKYFGGENIGSECIDNACRQVYAFNQKNKSVFMSIKEERGWRTTSEGIFGDTYSDEITDLLIETKEDQNSLITITLTDGSVTIDTASAQQGYLVSPDIRQKMNELAMQEFNRIKKGNQLKIPVIRNTTDQFATRPASVWLSSITFDSATSGTFSVTEEIDHRIGGNGYQTQNRVNKYKVTTTETKLIGSETGGYNIK